MKSIIIKLTIRLALFLIVACPPRVSAEPSRLSEIKSWAYQLQNISLQALAESPFDLLVIDYSLDGGAASEFSFDEIQALRAQGKIVLSYLSIGEAEEYRFYFSHNWVADRSGSPCGRTTTSFAPSWLDIANSHWCGNYKTRYWDKRWQGIIFGNRQGESTSYLDRILDAGFDGVYLDIIDGYEYWLAKRGSKRRKSAAKDMADFVVQLSEYARKKRGVADFIVVPQNGSSILNKLSAHQKRRYLSAIDGIGAEDTFYFGDEDEDNQLNVQPSLKNLRQYKSAGKQVLAIDYLTEPGKIEDFRRRACVEGFIPQVALRSLDNIEAQRDLKCE